MQLSLEENCLTELPNEMKNLSQLRILDLSGSSGIRGNSFKNLPTWIKELTLLEKLTAKSIELEIFPLEVCDLPHLSHLSLNQNLIESLPPQLGNAPSLEHLLLNVNRIKNCRQSLATYLG